MRQTNLNIKLREKFIKQGVKMIAPETLNPQVKGLLNRILVQRLAAEEN